MVDIKNIPAELKTSCRFCVWKFEKRNGQKTKMPYNPANGDRAKINDLRTFADFKTTLVTYAMGGYDGIGIAVGSGIGAFDIDHCIREDGTLNDTADTVLSIFPTAYVEKSPSGKGLRGFFHVPEDYVYDKTVYYINNRSKGLEVYMPGATNRFVTVTGDVYRTGEILNDETAMTTLLDTLMKRNKQVQQTHFQHHSYLDDEAVIAHANEASNSEKFKRLFAGEWEDLYGSQSDADMALLSILAFWCGCDEEQMDRIFRTSGLMRPKWDRKQAGSTYGAISIRNTVNTCAAVYMPVNAQDIVDEEFSKLDEDDYIEFQPDLTKITITLEEMAPHTNARYGRNEIGMGNMFADYFKQIARYNSERKGWYVYDGSVWRPDKGNLKVSELAKLLADKLYVFALTITEEDARKRFIDRVRKLQLRKNRETMLRDAMSVYPISMQAFDRNKYFFNCKNGTLDMRTLEFREHRPEDYLTMESGITYDPEADCPRWHSFIKEVMCGDADLADFLQRSLGYALTGDTSQECMFILYGATSRNGKGTAMETFLKIMGDYGKTSNPDMLAAKFRGGNTGGPSEEVARLVGSRFVNISEPEKKITFNAALVKRMTGNDTINARFLNENSFDFVPVFKIFINTNYLPNVNDMTLFQSGRLKIIPFNRHFEEGEQDQGLKGQFAKPENLSGIFNWCLEGYKKFCQRGLELPQAVTKATEDYKDDSDRIGQFIEACFGDLAQRIVFIQLGDQPVQFSNTPLALCSGLADFLCLSTAQTTCILVDAFHECVGIVHCTMTGSLDHDLDQFIQTVGLNAVGDTLPFRKQCTIMVGRAAEAVAAAQLICLGRIVVMPGHDPAAAGTDDHTGKRIGRLACRTPDGCAPHLLRSFPGVSVHDRFMGVSKDHPLGVGNDHLFRPIVRPV